jgi:hypothetical protein
MLVFEYQTFFFSAIRATPRRNEPGQPEPWAVSEVKKIVQRDYRIRDLQSVHSKADRERKTRPLPTCVSADAAFPAGKILGLIPIARRIRLLIGLPRRLLVASCEPTQKSLPSMRPLRISLAL